MFHLFKRVYIELDDAIDLNVNRLVISKENGGGILHDLQYVVHAQLIAHGETLEDLVGEGKTYPNFLILLNELNKKSDELGRIVIYCDKDAFLKMACTWLKIVLPNVTVDDAYLAVASNLFQTRMFGTSELSDFTRPYRLTMVDKYVSLQEFNQYYNSVNVDRSLYAGFVNLIRSGLSLEFIFASYLYNGSYKDELKSIAHNQIKVGMQLFLYECKTFIIENLLNKQVLDQFSPTVEYTPANLEECITDPAFNVWFEPSIWGVQSIGTPHTKSLINFKNISSSQFDKIVAHTAIWMQQFNTGCKPGTLSAGLDINNWFEDKVKTLKMCQQDTLSDADLSELVKIQIGDNNIKMEFTLFESVEQSKFSIYITEFIRQVYITNRKNRLLPFTLEQ